MVDSKVTYLWEVLGVVVVVLVVGLGYLHLNGLGLGWDWDMEYDSWLCSFQLKCNIMVKRGIDPWGNDCTQSPMQSNTTSVIKLTNDS